MRNSRSLPIPAQKKSRRRCNMLSAHGEVQSEECGKRKKNSSEPVSVFAEKRSWISLESSYFMIDISTIVITRYIIVLHLNP